DILEISEVRWTGQGCMRSQKKTIPFSRPEERHERGVGIVLRRRAAEALVVWRAVNERIITARFVTRHIRITVVQDIVDDIPRRDLKLIIGDFNATLMEKLKDPATTACFSLELRNRFAVLEEAGTLKEEWTSVKRVIQDCVQKVVGRRRGKRKKQWIQESTWEKIDERRDWKLRREQAKNENDADEQKERWLEHFRNILNQPEPQRTYCFEGLEPANELDVDVGSITPEETIEAIRCLRNGRASGIDEIPAELLKAGDSTMVKKLTELYNRCWNGGEVREDWRKGVIVKLPKKATWRTVKIGEVPHSFRFLEKHFALYCCDDSVIQ
ncbi:hypothetical protein V3C99_018736, partial [Haemonchus contortus]